MRQGGFRIGPPVGISGFGEIRDQSPTQSGNSSRAENIVGAAEIRRLTRQAGGLLANFAETLKSTGRGNSEFALLWDTGSMGSQYPCFLLGGEFGTCPPGSLRGRWGFLALVNCGAPDFKFGIAKYYARQK